MLRVAPTDERFFNYGVRHFDARIAGQYDVKRAYSLFTQLRARNAGFPYVHHELSRLEFLAGRFDSALAYINEEIIRHGEDEPNTYYMRALIRGYMKDYAGAAADYETYFKMTPANWAGINDYSWILLEAGHPDGAYEALEWGLKEWPGNAWLLANQATALYELERYEEAKKVAIEAKVAVEALTVAEWLNAYPGNDPLVAQDGLRQFKDATETNLAKILEAQR